MSLLDLLPEDLWDLIAKYTNTEEYTKLIQLYPDLFTENKLNRKNISQIPKNDLNLFAQKYEEATEIMNTQFRDKRINMFWLVQVLTDPAVDPGDINYLILHRIISTSNLFQFNLEDETVSIGGAEISSRIELRNDLFGRLFQYDTGDANEIWDNAYHVFISKNQDICHDTPIKLNQKLFESYLEKELDIADKEKEDENRYKYPNDYN